jgi:hypothetical protein
MNALLALIFASGRAQLLRLMLLTLLVPLQVEQRLAYGEPPQGRRIKTWRCVAL